MKDKKKIDLLIVDDHKIFIEGLSSLLSTFSDINIVGTAHNGNETIFLLEHTIVDVVITDINMPGMDGLTLTNEIKKRHPQIKVLALTMLNESKTILAMIKSGVTGYILKDTGKEELLTAIRTVACGDTFFSEEVNNTLKKNVAADKKTSPGNSTMPELSSREIEVLKLIAAEFTQQQIADKLFISPHTVIFHRRKLFYKLNVKNTAGLIKTAMENGLLDLP